MAIIKVQNDESLHGRSLYDLHHCFSTAVPQNPRVPPLASRSPLNQIEKREQNNICNRRIFWALSVSKLEMRDEIFTFESFINFMNF